MSNIASEGCLVASCCNQGSEYVINKLLKSDFSASTTHWPGISSYPWSVQTKYYTAELSLFTCSSFEHLNDDFIDRCVQAIVVIFDPSLNSWKDDIKQWLSRCEEAAVRLLVCSDCEEEQRSAVQTYCVENAAELIELDATSEDSCGLERLLEALHAHSWSDLVMLPEKPVGDRQQIDANSATHETVSQDNDKAESDTKNTEPSAANASGDGNPEHMQQFENLFANFASLKERARGLSGEERKKFAEKVAIDFWRAMGLDESEIAGLSSDEETP